MNISQLIVSCIEQVWFILEIQMRNQPRSLSDDEFYVQLQRAWFTIPESTLNKLLDQTTGRFQLCLQENGNSIGHLLYKLSPKPYFDINTILNSHVPNSQDIKEKMSHTPILGISLDMPPCKDLMNLIADRLLHSEYLPFILRKTWDIKYPLGYECIIKNRMDMHTIFENIDKNAYRTMSQFCDDIMLMWSNVRLFFGPESHPTKQVDKLEQDLSYVLNLQDNIYLLHEQVEEIQFSRL